MKQVNLGDETVILLGKAKAKYLLSEPVSFISSNKMIEIALRSYIGEQNGRSNKQK